MTAKRFTLIFVVVVGGFFLLNAILWHTVVGPIFTDSGGDNDLARSALVRIEKAQTPQAQEEKAHLEFADYVKARQAGEAPRIDVLTLGDSFSNGGGGCWYQDRLARESGLTVLNIDDDYNGLKSLADLEASGYLADIRPRYVVLECVERYAPDRAKEALAAQEKGNGEAAPSEQALEQKLLGVKTTAERQAEVTEGLLPPMMLQGNKSWLENAIRFRKGSRLSETVYQAELDRPLFSNPGWQQRLLYYYDEDWTAQTPPAEAARTMNEAYEAAAQHLAAQGIRLIVMVVVDKYDLYAPYARTEDGPVADNPFFDELDALPKTYTFINTKKILRPHAAAGEQDLFWLTDSHWSWRAQRYAVAAVREALEN